MFMAMFFLISGLVQLVVSVTIMLPSWGWQAADGLITLLLGLLVISECLLPDFGSSASFSASI